MLARGGLSASWTSDDQVDAVITCLDVLLALKLRPTTQIVYGFNLFLRVSDFDDATVEPPCWATFDPRLIYLSELGRGLGVPVDGASGCKRRRINRRLSRPTSSRRTPGSSNDGRGA